MKVKKKLRKAKKSETINRKMRYESKKKESLLGILTKGSNGHIEKYRFPKKRRERCDFLGGKSRGKN